MIQQWLSDLGPWSWFIIGLLLMLAELLLPGVFLIWFGVSALVIGTLTLISFTDVSWWPWQAQIVAFGVLSLVLALVGRRLFPSDTDNDAAAKINDPLSRHIGSEAVLHQAHPCAMPDCREAPVDHPSTRWHSSSHRPRRSDRAFHTLSG